MRRLAALVLALCLVFPAVAARKKKSRTPTRRAHTTARKSTARKSTAKKRTASKRKTKRRTSRTSSRRHRPVRRQSWRYGQMAPTPERYKQIQQVLIEKGYLKGTATGTWGADSTDALRRYQQSQNLEPTGKLDSLTLISLGLGPKRETGAVPAPPPPPPVSTSRGQQ